MNAEDLIKLLIGTITILGTVIVFMFKLLQKVTKRKEEQQEDYISRLESIMKEGKEHSVATTEKVVTALANNTEALKQIQKDNEIRMQMFLSTQQTKGIQI